MMIGSLQTRIIALFLVLMVTVQVGVFALINSVGIASAHKTAGDELAAGSRIFDRLLEQDTQRLVQGARLLSSDYAFREAIATGDAETVNSVLANHGKRIEADLMMLIGLDKRVVADTLGNVAGEGFPFPKLLAEAEGSGQAAAMVLLRGRLYQLVIVPVLAPLPIAWVGVGFGVNDVLAHDLKRLTQLQVSFLTRETDRSWHLQASTLTADSRSTLLRDFVSGRFADSDAAGNAVGSDLDATRVLTLPARAGETVVAILQQPLASALEPFRRLQQQLALISMLAVVVSIVASVAIARGIARPVRDLAQVARRIAAGKYMTVSSSRRSDEIGDLAAAFRTMQAGLAAREARITDLAFRDALTGLPNRTHFTARLDEALAAAAHVRTPVAVALLDLDHFKYVNDTLGHPIGDLLLREVAARLQVVVDKPTDIVARLGGDEFAILLPGHGVHEAQRIAEAIVASLEKPLTIEGHLVDVRPSIGIAAYPDHGEDSATLLRCADVAMYAAKRKNLTVAVWDDGHDRHSRDRLSLMSDLRKAVDGDELTLVYQPTVTLHGSGEHRVEALVRWRHPVRGLVSPGEFIPFAEQTGYIRAITQWVLSHAVMQCAQWRTEGLPVCISVNLSARDLMDAELPERFAALLRRHRCAAPWIGLEITESAILDDPAHAVDNLKRFHALGCRIAIDDYGTGYSSLAYLRRLPVHELKIDRTFISAMAADAGDALIVGSTIDLAHNMGLSVVAEGVENELTLERLRAMSCDMVQGFLISRPLGAGELPAWLRGSIWAKPVSEARTLRRVV
ncbi:MAG TPA: EAL domain-containing protein [Casimicrobiaceae bacterium]|nr:EAL domain-containing protein [Casimicrobiaceae bacterium]